MRTTRSTPETEAEGILATLWRDGAGEAVSVPVDPVAIARELGLEVFDVHLADSELSGMLARDAGQTARIYLNKAQHEHRRRFTCAHEIGHYVKRTIDGGEDAFEYVDRRDHLSERGTDPEERWANAFAAALLMPADYVIENFGALGHTGLAHKLGVSLEAMGHRISRLQSQGRL
jgi:Zn-dependent peptidase ImmA (M78 family)